MGATSRDQPGRGWFFAVPGAFVISMGVIALFRAPASPALVTVPPSRPAITETPKNAEGAHEQASFSDPTPLFLPTQWNAKPNVLPGAMAREAGEGFYEAQFTFPGNAAKLAFPNKVKVPEKPVEALSLWSVETPFLGMGQTDLKTEPLPERDALIEVMTANDGRQVFTQVLKGVHPPGGGDWQPMEFLVAVEAAGLVGLPALASRSNAREVTTYFQDYLAKRFRIGDRLAPGFYRIKVGP